MLLEQLLHRPGPLSPSFSQLPGPTQVDTRPLPVKFLMYKGSACIIGLLLCRLGEAGTRCFLEHVPLLHLMHPHRASPASAPKRSPQ